MGADGRCVADAVRELLLHVAGSRIGRAIDQFKVIESRVAKDSAENCIGVVCCDADPLFVALAVPGGGNTQVQLVPSDF